MSWSSGLAKFRSGNPLKKNVSPESFLYLLILFFLPTQLGKHFWPESAFVFGLRIDYLSPTIYLTDIFLCSLFLLLILETSKLFSAKNILQVVQKHTLPLLVIVSLLLGILLAKNPVTGIFGFMRLLEIIFFAWYTKRFFEKQKDALHQVATVFAAGVIAQSFLAIAQFLAQSSLGGILYFFGERSISPMTPGAALSALSGVLTLRPYGTFSHPNVLAGYLLLGLAFLGLALGAFRKYGKVFILLSLFLGSVALFVTQSRSAIVLWLFAVFVFAYQLIKQQQKAQKKMVIFLVVFLGGISVLSFLLSPRLLQRFALDEILGKSLQERILLANVALRMFFDHPLLGVGLQNFIPVLPQYLRGVASSLLQPVHSVFLLVLAETGLMGFLGCIFLLISIRMKNRKEKSLFISRRMFLLILLLMLGVSDHYLLTQQQGRLLLGFLLGICFVDAPFVRLPIKKKYS